MSRYVVNGCKRTIVYLLRAAHFVEFDYFHSLGIVEVTEGGINECKVTILANTQHSEVGRVCRQQLTISLTFSLSIFRIAT